MAQELAILTPEKAIITFRIAGIGSRIGAFIFDVVLLLVAWYAVLIGMFLLSMVAGELLPVVVATMLPVFFFAYFILFEGFWNGQTLGKRAFGLRVRRVDGRPVSIDAVLGRNLLRPVDIIVGIAVMFANIRSQRLGDMISSTVVVSERGVPHAAMAAPHHFNIHPLEKHVGSLRKMTDDEYAALRRMCDRFPELGPAVQDRMLRDVWHVFAQKHGISPIEGVHPLYLAEAVVMCYGRENGLL